VPKLRSLDDASTRDFISIHDIIDVVMLMFENNAAIGKIFHCYTDYLVLSTTDFLFSLAQTLIAARFRTIQ
jgi:nucleoside-diphosphate-sugar epimerase